MRTIGVLGMAFLCFAGFATAQSRWSPTEANVRFSEQISNGPAGSCGCFAMEGFGGDLAWTLHQYGMEHSRALGGVADVSVEHTGKVSNAPFGLTLTTVAFGPRFTTTGFKSTHLFAQSLFGITHGSNSEFPVHNTLAPSANSFALDLGAGAEHALGDRLAIRMLQVEYLRTSLPNNSTDWQNNLRLSAGITFRFGR